MRCSVWSFVLFLVAGCGFQLQGQTPLPESFTVTHIDAPDRYTLFYQDLARSLKSSGIEVVDSSARADSIIRILEDETGQRVLSVNERNVPAEYLVFYTVTWSVSASGQEVMPPQTLTLTRNYTYDETLVLGKAREEVTLQRALSEDLVNLVRRRLASLETSSPTAQL